jgi:RimJ/RimL family protein N-acetyltransferase
VAAKLSLRPPLPSDGAAYLALFQRPEIVAWLRPEPLPPFTDSEIREMLAEDVRHWGDFGYGPWALIEKSSDSFVGRAGLRRTAVEGEPAVELAWTVDPDRQGEGLATEAALAAVDLAARRAIDEVVALALPANRASCRVAERAGLQRSGEVEHAGLVHVLYRLRLA